MSKRRIFAGLIVAILILGIVAVAIYSSIRKGNAVLVDVAEVQKGTLQNSVTVNGNLESLSTKTYYSPVSAQINQCNVQEGSFVYAGTKLITFDTSALEREHEKARLQTSVTELENQSALAENNRTQKQYQQALSDIEASKQSIGIYKQAIIDLTNAIEMKKTQLATGTELTSDLSLSDLQSQLEEARLALTQLESQKEAQEAQASSLEENLLSQTKRQAISTNTLLAKSEASFSQELLEKGRNGITAEFDGVVTKLSVKSGEETEIGTELFTIASIREVAVRVELNKTNFLQVKEGEKATIKFHDKIYEGTVLSVDRMASTKIPGGGTENGSSSVVYGTVKIDNPDDALCLGLDAKVTIYVEEKEKVLQIPREAVNQSAEGTFCYVVKDNTLVKKEVETGLSSDKAIEIRKGLNTGELVVLNLPDGVEEGDSVQSKKNVKEKK